MLLDIFTREIRTQIPEAELWCVCEQPPDIPALSGVEWFHLIPEAQLAELYRRAWVFCLPSTYEGFGVPYIEAMASGTAVVASRNPGAVEVTSGGEFGVIAEDSDLGNQIVSLLEDQTARERLALLGLERVKDFSWASVCEQYEALFSARQPTECAT